MTIDSQKNIKEFSIQAFRKICDAMVLSPPAAVKDAADWDEKRFRLLDGLNKKVLEYAGADVPAGDHGERPGEFMQKHQIIESLRKYWRVTSMNLETIIDEFVFNAIGRGI